MIVILSRPLNLQGLFGASKRKHIRCIQASFRPQPRSARGSLRKHKALLLSRKLRIECFLLWIQVHVTQPAKGLSCVKEEWELWGSELIVSQSPPSRLPPTALQLGRSYCSWGQEETALNIAFLLVHGGRSANKIRTRLEGQREKNFHSGAYRHLRATQQWMQLNFLSSFPSWKSPSLGTRVPGSQVFTNLLEVLRWVIDPRVQFPISWIRETGLAPEHLIQTEAQCQSVDKWIRGASFWVCWGCLWWAGGFNLSVDVHVFWTRDQEWQITWHTAAVTLRTLEALPTGTYHHLGSVRWDQVFISQKLPVGKLVDSSTETQNRLMTHLS